MTVDRRARRSSGAGPLDRGISALNGWLGDYFERTGNDLGVTMAPYRDNRPLLPEDLSPSPTGKVCVLVHGLGCNESSWNPRRSKAGRDYGDLLHRRFGYQPLYIRYNTGLHVSVNGRLLAELIRQLVGGPLNPVGEVVFIGHSMGGLVIRSACHIGQRDGHEWVPLVRHAIYLGTPHLGAPLEKGANVASFLLSRFDTTATRVVRELLDSRSPGVKDLRYGSLVDEDWLENDPDEVLTNRRVPVPWPAGIRHHQVFGEIGRGLGDAVVLPRSAAGRAEGRVTGAPEATDTQVMPGMGHMTLARHPAVYEHIERWVAGDG